MDKKGDNIIFTNDNIEFIQWELRHGPYVDCAWLEQFSFIDSLDIARMGEREVLDLWTKRL